MNVALGRAGEDDAKTEDNKSKEVEYIMARKDYNLWMERQESRRKTLLTSGTAQICQQKNTYFGKEREVQITGGKKDEIAAGRT